MFTLQKFHPTFPPLSQAADWWSLGVFLFEMIVGKVFLFFTSDKPYLFKTGTLPQQWEREGVVRGHCDEATTVPDVDVA